MCAYDMGYRTSQGRLVRGVEVICLQIPVHLHTPLPLQRPIRIRLPGQQLTPPLLNQAHSSFSASMGQIPVPHPPASPALTPLLLAKANATAHAATTSTPVLGMVDSVEYRDNNGSWQPYAPEAVAIVKAAYLAGQMTPVYLGKIPYTVDLVCAPSLAYLFASFHTESRETLASFTQ